MIRSLKISRCWETHELYKYVTPFYHCKSEKYTRLFRQAFWNTQGKKRVKYPRENFSPGQLLKSHFHPSAIIHKYRNPTYVIFNKLNMFCWMISKKVNLKYKEVYQGILLLEKGMIRAVSDYLKHFTKFQRLCKPYKSGMGSKVPATQS